MTKPAFTHKGYHGTAEVSTEDDCLHGKVLFIDDLITFEGDSPRGLKQAFIDAVDRYIAYCEKTGKPANKPYSGTFNVRLGSDLHRDSCIAASESEQSLNEFVRDCIITCLTKRQFVVQVQENHHHYYSDNYDEEPTPSWSQKNLPPESRAH